MHADTTYKSRSNQNLLNQYLFDIRSSPTTEQKGKVDYHEHVLCKKGEMTSSTVESTNDGFGQLGICLQKLLYILDIIR